MEMGDSWSISWLRPEKIPVSVAAVIGLNGARPADRDDFFKPASLRTSAMPQQGSGRSTGTIWVKRATVHVDLAKPQRSPVVPTGTTLAKPVNFVIQAV